MKCALPFIIRIFSLLDVFVSDGGDESFPRRLTKQMTWFALNRGKPGLINDMQRNGALQMQSTNQLLNCSRR